MGGHLESLPGDVEDRLPLHLPPGVREGSQELVELGREIVLDAVRPRLVLEEYRRVDSHHLTQETLEGRQVNSRFPSSEAGDSGREASY